ncbi:MAG: hypothetical protein H0W08_02665 [Acidobacteria bacterium]|nr:hypothetical protein [Acidobacteriota bacterium]
MSASTGAAATAFVFSTSTDSAAEQPPDSLLFPSFANRDNSIFIMSLTGVGNSALLRGVTGNNLQRQQPGQLAGGIGAAGRRLLREELLLNPNHRSLR